MDPTTDEKPLAAAAAAAQDSRAQHDNGVNREGPNARRRTRQRRPTAAAKPPRPENLPFAERLSAAMKDKNNMSPSDLAKLVWGTTKDRRGYTVARNRDRIGHYLAGTSYPDPANLERIAEVLDVPVEELAVERPPRPPVTPRTFVSHHSSDTAKVGTLILTSLPTEQPQLTKIRLQVDLVLPWKLATEIQQKLLNRTETETEAEREEPPQLGTVIHGSKP